MVSLGRAIDRYGERAVVGIAMVGMALAMAAAAFATNGAAIKAENPAAHARITEALGVLGQAYPGAARPAKLPVEPGAVSGASAKVMLAAAG